MSKALELVVISILLIAAFFCGVAYSNQVKENFNWLFEVKEQEAEIPNKDLNIAKPYEIHRNPENTENNIENNDENSQNIENNVEEIKETNNINNL